MVYDQPDKAMRILYEGKESLNWTAVSQLLSMIVADTAVTSNTAIYKWAFRGTSIRITNKSDCAPIRR